MFTITVEHKYCGMKRTVEAESIAQAFKNYGMSYQVWIVKNIEKNT